MYYREYLPPQNLAAYVKCFWVLESGPDYQAGPTEQVLPDGCMEMVFHYGEAFHQYQSSQLQRQPRSLLYGQITRFIELVPAAQVAMIAVRFHPWGLYPFLGLSPQEFTNECIDLHDLFGQDSRDLEDQILSAASNDQRLQWLQLFLHQQLFRYQQIDPLIGQIGNTLIAQGGKLEINEMLQDFTISPRHFQRKFLQVTGLQSKMLSRIIRFQHSLQLAEAPSVNNLTELAYKSGYFDQAHFIRDFKAFTGYTPKAYFKKDHQFSDYFVSG